MCANLRVGNANYFPELTSCSLPIAHLIWRGGEWHNGSHNGSQEHLRSSKHFVNKVTLVTSTTPTPRESRSLSDIHSPSTAVYLPGEAPCISWLETISGFRLIRLKVQAGGRPTSNNTPEASTSGRGKNDAAGQPQPWRLRPESNHVPSLHLL